jgi:uncharacterized protein involved in tolerance to divalent cations
LIDVSGARWVLSRKAQEYVDSKVFCFTRVFESHTDAYKWKERRKADKEPSIAIKSSDSSSKGDSSNEETTASRVFVKQEQERKEESLKAWL